MYTIIYAISINWLCLFAFSPFDFLFFFFFFIFFVGECLKQKRENIFFFLYKLDNKTDLLSFFLASRNRPYIIPFLTLFSRMRRFSTLFFFFNHTLLIYPLLSNHVGWLGWLISLALVYWVWIGLWFACLYCLFAELQLKIHLS